MPSMSEESLVDRRDEETNSPRFSNAASTASNDRTTTANVSINPRSHWFILEPIVFLVYLAINLSGTVYQNQILYQTCIAVFNYNDTQCQPLLGVEKQTPDTQHIEDVVQPYAARILMVRSLLESIFPAIISLFIGPWSDKFGRRPVLLTTISSYLASFIILTVLAAIASKVLVTPWIFLLSSMPIILSGGTCAFIIAIYCYISDVAIDKGRRLVINEAALGAGMGIGSVVSGYLYSATNAITVFVVSTIIMICALVYVYFFVIESLRPDQIQFGSKIRKFFHYELVVDLVRTCLKRRPSFDRAIIWMTMISLVVATFASNGDSNVTYLFLRKKFAWTLKDYSNFNTASIGIQIVGSIMGIIILRRVFKLSIVSTTIISIICCVLESTMRGIATIAWELYLGMALGCMRGIMTPMLRAILAHVAPATEIGKIFALTNSFETISPLGAAPLYTLVYNATLDFYPGLFNFISAGLYIFCLTLIVTIYAIQRSLGNTDIGTLNN